MTDTAALRASGANTSEFDAIIIGAGFGGMYALHILREQGLKVRVYDEAAGVGGTWFWNRYPGARVDYPGGPFYCYTFSEDLIREFDWPDTQPDQPTVLRYLNFVADRLDLRRDIELGTRITGASYDEAAQRWDVATSTGERLRAQFVVCAVGALSAANIPDIPGRERFQGECYHTGRWPHDKTVSFTGKRVGLIGTGSSGIQSTPEIARDAAHLTVFQRTPQYSVPCGNRPTDPELVAAARANWPKFREIMLRTPIGSPDEPSTLLARDHTPEQRRAVYEAAWGRGGIGSVLVGTYADILTDKQSNEWLAEFVREKIAEVVEDPETARKLMPSYMIGTKRQVMDDGYYQAFNRDNVSLVDLREDPIVEITERGVRTQSGEHPLDMLVYATGFDAITGALQNIDPRGRDGVPLTERWAQRFNSYLGLTIPGLPNLFMIHGPESPCVLYNMPLGAEQEADWIRDCIVHLREHGIGAIEPAPGVDLAWAKEVEDWGNTSLYPEADSWYMGSNIPGKHRQFAVHLGGPEYFRRIRDVAEAGYPGFVTEPERSRAASAG
ncbi:MAG: NAD(P)/FAD-dependent oxidoreductase [Gammaproteobacteria bacterium]|nr:NAD(P)/FAD-dependent oxidoreductase [Gammaproteobacteria bacterium]MCP5201475.1 NAD(P)/FAD-dependent oxidoreductase [Gammaproteobacteria bacterium]